MELNTTHRIDYLDTVKALAIFCVILGHSIQYFDVSGELKWMYSFIYSFHMPLFMAVSGFFLSKLFDMRLTTNNNIMNNKKMQ